MQKIATQKGSIQWKYDVLLGMVCVLVTGIFVWSAEPGFLELTSLQPKDTYYNLLVRGFRAGQLNLPRAAPPELAQLANPYDPAINAPYVWNSRSLLLDMSYHKGKLYLYFGVTPALVLFWPYLILTGHYLLHKDAVVIFCALGFLVAAGLLRAVWRRYFPEMNVWVVVAGLLALGLVTGIPELLSRCDVWEVAISGGFVFVMLALAAIWQAPQKLKRQTLWLGLGSLAYGLAIGCRPSLVFGAIILLVPVVQAWRVRAEPGSYRWAGWLLAAAVIPLTVIGLGLMLYNNLRFGNPFEFGWHYQLATAYVSNTARQFSPHYLWVNFRFYFLDPMRWAGHFPFLKAIPLSPLPSGYFGVGEPYSGILGNYPLVWLALASPLAWRGRQAKDASGLRWFVMAVFTSFAVCALTLCLFFTASARYEIDFLPALMLLSVIGIFGVERVLVGSPWRFPVRLGWCLLLVYSLMFNLLASVEAHAAADYSNGTTLVNQGRVDEGIRYLRTAVALEPQSATRHLGLGYALCAQGRVPEAIIQYQKAIALQPDSAYGYDSLGNALLQIGDIAGAKTQYQKALEIKPDFAEAYGNLGRSLLRLGQVDEAIVQLQERVALQPESAVAHNELGYCLLRAGRLDDAVDQFQKSLEIQPDNYEVCYILGTTYYREGMAAKAIACYGKVVELRPQFIPAKLELAWILATWPEPSVRNGERAVALARQAEQLTTRKSPQILRTLAAAYAEEGQFSNALATAREGLALATSQSDPRLASALQKEIELYQANSPCRYGNN